MSAMTYAPTAPVKRPGVLNAGLFTALLSAIAGIAGAVAIFAGGKEMVGKIAGDYLAEQLGFNAGDLSGEMYDAVIGEAYSSLQFRAGVVVFFGVLVLVAALTVINGSTGGRVFLTIVAPLSIGWYVLVIADLAPVATKSLGAVSIVAALVAVVLLWLSPVGRFAKARKR